MTVYPNVSRSEIANIIINLPSKLDDEFASLLIDMGLEEFDVERLNSEQAYRIGKLFAKHGLIEVRGRVLTEMYIGTESVTW